MRRRDSLGDPCWLSPATSTWPCCSWPPWTLPTQVSRRSHLWGRAVLWAGRAEGQQGCEDTLWRSRSPGDRKPLAPQGVGVTRHHSAKTKRFPDLTC